MRIAPTWGLTAAVVVVVTAAHVHAADSVAEAQRRIQAARDNLAKAVQRIEKDPPSVADLDAAHAAVQALKEAIDAGGELEANDLEYAKAVLSARKELRVQREYVDQRRANIKGHEARRTLDASVAAMGESGKRLDAKEPSAKDFDDARAAAATVKKDLEEARPFAKRDPKLAAFLSEVEGVLDRHEKKVDDRWLQLSADKQRGVLSAARQALVSSLAAVSKETSTERFEAANKDLSGLEKKLSEGKPLETKDKLYRADADRARVELAQAKKRMEELLSQAALDKLKAEIEPAHKDLAASRKVLRSGPPNEEQLAEARTAIVVVKKLTEKFQPQAERSKAFGAYLDEVKKTLAETEVALQRRTLDAAKRQVTLALRQVERRNATDESFDEAKTAVTVLEKTLDGTNARDPELAPSALEAKQLVRDAQTTLAKRRVEVDIVRHRAKVDESKRKASELVRQLYQAKPTDDEVKAAEASVKQVQATLEEGAAYTKKDGEYAAYAKDTRERIADLNGRISARKIQLAAGDGRTQLAEALAAAKPKVDAAKGPEASDAEIDEAGKSVEAVSKALESRAALEKQDVGYAANAARAREQLARLNEGMGVARKARGIRKQTVEALVAASSAIETAEDSRNLKIQRDHYEKAVGQLKICSEEGGDAVKVEPALGKLPVMLNGAPSTPKAVIGQCEAKLKSIATPLEQVKSLIALEEGPKASYEKAKALLARGKKSEASDQFIECIASGRLLAHKYPELKEHKVAMGGGTTTLDELVRQCVDQRKAISGK